LAAPHQTSSPTWQLPVERVLDDGSFLKVIRPTGVSRAQAAEQAIRVRVIEYALPGVDDAQPRYRLLTTLLDPQLAPAMELAELCHQRWEIEAVFDELKTHLRAGPARAAQQDPRTGAPGVLRLGAGALRGSMSVAPWGHPPPDTPCRSVLEGTRRTAQAHTAPIRGLSPQSGPDVDDGGSVSCCRPAPAHEQREPSTGDCLAWSSAATVSTLLTIAP